MFIIYLFYYSPDDATHHVVEHGQALQQIKNPLGSIGNMYISVCGFVSILHFEKI